MLVNFDIGSVKKFSILLTITKNIGILESLILEYTKRHIPLSMSDWAKHLDLILQGEIY